MEGPWDGVWEREMGSEAAVGVYLIGDSTAAGSRIALLHSQAASPARTVRRIAVQAVNWMNLGGVGEPTMTGKKTRTGGLKSSGDEGRDEKRESVGLPRPCRWMGRTLCSK